ncbi:MAG: hypothetical protein ACJ8F7_03670 [Gemmataceae bacterium]
MPIAVICPNCSARIKAPDTAVGKTVKCPKCGSPMQIAGPPPKPEPAAVVEAIQDLPPDEQTLPRRRRGRDDADERRPRKKKSNKGLYIGLGIGGVLLLSLCCCGGGFGLYYGGVFEGLAGNANVTNANYHRLQPNMTMAQVEAILGSGTAASAGDVADLFQTEFHGFAGREEMLARVQAAFQKGAAAGSLYRWKNGGEVIFVLFSAPPKSGGKAQYFYYRKTEGNASSSESNGSL